MNVFPAFFNLSGRKVVIVGGGENAARKARLLLAANASVTFVSQAFSATLREEFDGKAIFHAGPLSDQEISEATLAVVAEEDTNTQEEVAGVVRAQGVPVNVVDRPDLSDFMVPSIVDRGDVVVGISTSGTSPVFGRRLREKIENWLPQRTGALAKFARSFREAVAAKIPSAYRRQFWEEFFDGPIAELVLRFDERRAHAAMENRINFYGMKENGVVHIVGAGPGDPELLTLKAHRLLQAADVILYDRLVGVEILNLARRDAVRMYVGKQKANHAVPQNEIETLMISFAREGKTVVRLKGGDPFIFGRGGEELEAIRAAGIDVFITPGITAATGCAASAEMALTHRNYAQSVTFVTGHAQGHAEPDLDWAALAALRHTLVVYMGVGKAPIIAEQLISNGRRSSTPVAIIENGTCKNEVIVKGTLGALAQLVEQSGIKGPALLVIGEVADLATQRDLRTLVEAGKEAA